MELLIAAALILTAFSRAPPDRGKTSDLHTHESWELPDAEHMRGGA